MQELRAGQSPAPLQGTFVDISAVEKGEASPVLDIVHDDDVNSPPAPANSHLRDPNQEMMEDFVAHTPERDTFEMDIATPGLTVDFDKLTKPSPVRTPVQSQRQLQPWDLIEPPQSVKGSSQSHRRLIPKSSYYFAPPPPNSAFYTQPQGVIGVHHPREILRIERDYTGGETVVQFAPIWLLELEGRITPTQFLESINLINEHLIEVHAVWKAAVENVLECASLGLSRLLWKGFYQRVSSFVYVPKIITQCNYSFFKDMEELQKLFDQLNRTLFNPAGLNLLWPRKVGFLFVSSSLMPLPCRSLEAHGVSDGT